MADLGPLHADVQQDPFLEQLCHRLFEEAAGNNPLGDLFADGALETLVSALLRLARRRVSEPERRRRLPA